MAAICALKMSVVTNCRAAPPLTEPLPSPSMLLLLLLSLLALLLLALLLELLLGLPPEPLPSPLSPLTLSPEASEAPGSTQPGGARPAAMRDARKGPPACEKCAAQETEEPSAQQEKQRRGVMPQWGSGWLTPQRHLERAGMMRGGDDGRVRAGRCGWITRV